MSMLHGADLIKAGRDITLPFDIEVVINGGAKKIVCLDLFRLLPGQRLVCRADFDGQPVLCKVFFGDKRARHAAKEICGASLLAHDSIRTPKQAGYFPLPGQQLEIVLFDFLPQATSLARVWLDSDGHNKSKWLAEVVAVIAKMHAMGVKQDDIHFDNFMVSDGLLYVIDGGGVTGKLSNEGLGKKETLINLGLFLAQLIEGDDWIDEVAGCYRQHRPEFKLDVVELRRSMQQQFMKRKKKALEKIYRDCTQFSVARNWRLYQVATRLELDDDLEILLKNPDEAIANGHLLKDGNSSTVALVKTPIRQYVVKRYNIKNWRHLISRCWRPSRAWHCWWASHLLLLLGIDVPKPLAMLECRWGLLRHKAYFVSEHVGGDDIHHVVSRAALQKDSEYYLKRFVEVLGKFYRFRITHGDLKATNILWSENKPWLIDLDSFKEHRSESAFQRGFNKDVDRLLKNWQGDDRIQRLVRSELSTFTK